MSDGAEIELSAAEARGVAIAAQGLGRPRPNGRIDARRLRRGIDDVGLLQLDSVNVLCRSHYMPLFSRLGPYSRTVLDGLASHADAAGPATRTGRDRSLFEYWGHEASLLPVELQPLLRWRMARAEKLTEKPARLLAAEKPELLKSVLRMVRERGPVRAADLATPVRKPKNPWYNWSETKIALDYLFFAGLVCADHRVRFERRYDLPERVLPKAVLDAPTPPEDEAQRQLLLIAAERLGVATEPDLGDYFRLPRKESKARVAELVEAGTLTRTRVEGWSAPAYVMDWTAPDARTRGTRPAVALRLRWSGRGHAPNGSSTSVTGSSSTPRRPSGSTVTTCFPSSSATVLWHGSTSRATAVRGSCGCSARSPSRGLISARWLRSWRTRCGCSPAGSTSNTSRWRGKATSPRSWRRRSAPPRILATDLPAYRLLK